MRLESLRIENFRCFSDETISFQTHVAFLGENGAGKSSILAALNVLFRNAAAATDVVSLSREDFHHQNTEKPVVITATFTDLTPECVQDFNHYARNGRLIITARGVFDEEIGNAPVIQYGARLMIPEFREFFQLYDDGASANELKALYKKLRNEIPSLPHQTVKAKMKQELIDYGEANPTKCRIEEDKDQFYGWSRGTNLLAQYVHWVYVPAVKEASTEQTEAKSSALGALLQRTIRRTINFNEALEDIRKEALDKYNRTISENNSALESIRSSLEISLRAWSHPNVMLDLGWDQDEQRAISITEPFAKATIGEGPFSGDVNRLGHGLQRAFILAVLQELPNHSEEGEPTLILGIEEPELYQHPPQARHFAQILGDLSKSGTQVLFTTHSPIFVSPSNFEAIRVVRKTTSTGASTVNGASVSTINTALAQALGKDPGSQTSFVASMEQILRPEMAELFFCRLPVLVEGIEDIALLASYMKRSNRWEAFRKLGIHFVACGGKTNISRPYVMANALGIPAFVVFDGDTSDTQKKEDHKRDNSCLLTLAGHESEDPLSQCHILKSNLVMWAGDIQSAIKDDVGGAIWEAALATARCENGLEFGIRKKNRVLLAAAIDVLCRDRVTISVLEPVAENILRYAESIS